jgi:DnaJ domain
VAVTRPEPFDLLGIRRGAAADEIRRAFAAAVRQVHPDSAGGRPDAAERLAHLIEARDELLAALGRPTGPPTAAPPPTSYRSLTRLQRAARILGRLLYVSPHQ